MIFRDTCKVNWKTNHTRKARAVVKSNIREIVHAIKTVMPITMAMAMIIVLVMTAMVPMLTTRMRMSTALTIVIA